MNPFTGAPDSWESEETQAVLSWALREAHGADARLEAWTADVDFTRYGKRRVVRYSVEARLAHAPELQRFEWVGKVYERDDDARRVAGVLQTLATRRDGGCGRLTAPRVVAYHASRRLLLVTYEPGESVTSAIGSEAAAVLQALGCSLAALHTSGLTVGPLRTPAALLAELRPRIADLCTRFPGDAAFLRDSLDRLEQDAPLLPPTPSFVHGDFGPANLLWIAGHIVVLDFDKCARGDPALDLGNLLAQLRRMSVCKPDRLPDFAAARRGVLAAYHGSSPPDPDLRQRLAWYELATLLRKVHRLALTATCDEATRLLRLCGSHAA